MTMSKYTTELRYICESELMNRGIDIKKLTVDEIIQQAIPYVIDFNFPIFDEAYRPILLQNIFRHYYTREIGAETVGRWKLFLNSKLNLIMPKYNLLYESEFKNIDPLINNWEKETFTKETSGTSDIQGSSSSTRDGTDTADSTFSDTPQGMLSGRDYATNATKNKTVATEKGSGNSSELTTLTNNEQWLREKKGLFGKSTTEAISEFVDKFQTIDMMIIDELSDMFMLIW